MGTSSNFGNMFSAAGFPTDNVDEDQLRRPSHWDIAFIRRFMIFFGPLSSVFNFITFGVMLWIFHAGPAQFRSGWFVESLATQTLVIFAIRTRRIPFFRSHPSLPLALAALAAMVAGYLALIELGKRIFYRAAAAAPAPPARPARFGTHHHQLRRRAARFSTSAGHLGLPAAHTISSEESRYAAH